MSLTKKLIYGVLFLLFVVLMGTYAITLNNSAHFYRQQLNNNAQDTATSLGLSLSHYLSKTDKAMMLSMVQAVFDQGYFASIEIYNHKDELLISRKLNESTIKVPDWFRDLISWPSTSQKNVIMDGWKQVGYLVVTTDPEIAYLSIWQNAKFLLIWYLLFALITSITIFISIRIIMKPLDRVTEQAQDICDRRFVIQANIPKTPELKKLTLAMNRMVHHLKSLFRSNMSEIQRLRQQAYVDQLTNLGNRRFFLQQFNYLLTNKEEFCPGYFILVTIEGLDDLNIHSGYAKGDEIILAFSKYIQQFWSVHSQILICRIGGSQFGLVIKEISKELILSSIPDFSKGLAKIKQQDDHVEVFFSVVPYAFNQSSSNVLTLADQALNKARESGESYHVITDGETKIEVVDPNALKSALITDNFIIYEQAVVGSESILHQELYLRIMIDDKEIGANAFLPIAQRSGLSSLIDNLMIDNVEKLLIQNDSTYAMNLSLNTILEQGDQLALLAKLNHISRSMRHRLAFEIPEVWLVSNQLTMMGFINQIIDLGFQFGIDQAGVNLSTMNYLQEIPLSYVKIHGSLIHDAFKTDQSEMMLRYIIDLLQTVGIEAIATQVQSLDQVKQMKKMGIQWLQGYEISASKKINV
jgi:diguanylate cyclase (GGDEF)-like protein